MKFINTVGLFLLSFLLSIHPSWSQQNKAGMSSCHGSDLLEKLKKTNPDAHAKILASAKKTLNGHALFWKIQAPDRPDSYLLGTIHLTDYRVTDLPDQIANRLNSAKSLALEIADLDQSSIARRIGKMGRTFVFTDGNTLEKFLSPAEFKQVESIILKSGFPRSFAPLMKPWFATLLLSHPDCELQRAKSGIPFLDKLLAIKAKEIGIDTVGLETPQEQLNALASLPLEDQQIFLKESLRVYDQLEDMNETMIQLYLKRLIGAVWPLTIQMSATPNLTRKALFSIQQKLVVDRNIKMIRRAIPILKKGGAFIAVGALHLPGEKGLVNLFREAGYKLTAIDWR